MIAISCNNDNESGSSAKDTSSTSGADLLNNESPLAGDTISRDLAIEMIKKFQTNTYRLQMVRLDGDKIRQLTNAQDSIRLWMAVDTNNKITMILQQKRTQPQPSYKYYNLSMVLGAPLSANAAETFLCPEPPNCDIQIEL